ncbi:glyoxalase [Rhodococcus sp. KBS0724]|uniref:VOC family protein n=1 Tax=Rhodococcus sp. KBS0724 TaxID=1179674 RepID=UPI00110ED1E3|nr:VOC family protein [Rhodococcus sp. KBS0724]TSD40376.1 glyoxalase [Rhodococcus sp. KBS0724]
MSYISALGYIGIGAKSLDDWQEFSSEVLGLQTVREKDADGVDTLFLRMDQRHHRIAVREGDDSLSYVGWEVATEKDLDSQADALKQAGVTVTEEPDLAVIRQVQRLIRCEDPAGFQTEIYFGPATTRAKFISPTGVSFVTRGPDGRDLGLGHIVLVAPNMDELIQFYIDLLGFQVSDYMTFPGIKITFTHVNPRHHSLAFGPAPEGRGAYLDHIMLEVNDLDGVGRALDMVRTRELSLTASLGRHTNDEMLSFYVQSPSGIGIEYGTAGKLIDDATWTVSNWDSSEFWGHDRSNAH